MRQFFAVLVLLCFGITIPSAALTMRICLSDGVSMGSGFATSEKATFGSDNDCSDCCKKDKSCCAELKKLPDSTLRFGDFQLPDLVVVDLPPLACWIAPLLDGGHRIYRASVPIRGPDLPSVRRAILAVWII